MVRVIDQIGIFKIVKTQRDYVVINTTLPYRYHSHFQSEQSARKCIQLILNGEIPKSPRMHKAVSRLITYGQYEQMRLSTPPQHYNDKHCRGYGNHK